MSITITELMSRAHRTACDKGWWDVADRSIGEQIALMHSELSEALEEVRKDASKLRVIYHSDSSSGPKPEGFASELADVLIRIADTCEKYGVPLSEAVEEKLIYNATRPYRHGGKAM